jgi:hypothetical protein
LVAVREAQVRSPRCASEDQCSARTHPLPLSADARTALLAFLKAGGNNDNIDDGQVTTIAYPEAEERWGKLLDKLQSAENLDHEDLTNGTYQEWFSGAPIRQVIDAREEAPPSCAPRSLQNERFIWIFTCGEGDSLGGVLVQATPAKREEN